MSTGDVGRFDAEGRLTVEGRADDMIVSGGENVFPEEVEQLLADHDAIAEVAVVGVADEQFGQRLKAFVVRDPGATLTAEDVRAYVRSNLARHKVPRDVEFTDELPRNATGQTAAAAPQRGERTFLTPTLTRRRSVSVRRRSLASSNQQPHRDASGNDAPGLSATSSGTSPNCLDYRDIRHWLFISTPTMFGSAWTESVRLMQHSST